jgi:hypothetical protein
MFKLDTEQALLDAFRPRDRSLVELPPGTAFPFIVRHYRAWAHPAGGRVYLLFAVPGGAPTGIVLDSNGSPPIVPAMCDWCHCSSSGTGVGLLTARVHSKKTAGVQVCADLGCQRKLEDDANRSGRNVRPALDALVARMGRFASEALKIDLSGAGR